MKANLPTLTLAFGVAVLCSASAQAQPEGQPCAPEPTDQLVAYGDHVNPCAIDQAGDSDLFRFQGVAGELVSIRATDQSGGGSIPGCRLELLRVTEGSSTSQMTYNVEYQCLTGSCPSFHKLTVGGPKRK